MITELTQIQLKLPFLIVVNLLVLCNTNAQQRTLTVKDIAHKFCECNNETKDRVQDACLYTLELLEYMTLTKDDSIAFLETIKNECKKKNNLCGTLQTSDVIEYGVTKTSSSGMSWECNSCDIQNIQDIAFYRQEFNSESRALYYLKTIKGTILSKSAKRIEFGEEMIDMEVYISHSASDGLLFHIFTLKGTVFLHCIVALKEADESLILEITKKVQQRSNENCD